MTRALFAFTLVVLFTLPIGRAWAYEQASAGALPERGFAAGPVSTGQSPPRSVSASTPSAGEPMRARTSVVLRAPASVRDVSSAAPHGEQASPAESSSRTASIRAIRQVFGARAPAAIRVARCETGNTFYARSANWTDRHSDGSRGSFGLFQIGALHRRAGESVAAFARRMFDPVANSRVAYRMSRGGTRWSPAWRRCAP